MIGHCLKKKVQLEQNCAFQTDFPFLGFLDMPSATASVSLLPSLPPSLGRAAGSQRPLYSAEGHPFFGFRKILKVKEADVQEQGILF